MRRKYERQVPPKRYRVQTRFVYNRTPPRFDFLKYLRIARKYIHVKYDITLHELETMLYLYNQNIFTKTQFEEYREIHSWRGTMFDEMYKRGLIGVWREAFGRNHTLYELSASGKRICGRFYKILIGEMDISEDKQSTPFFKRQTYTDKVYANAISKMNADEDRKKLTQPK